MKSWKTTIAGVGTILSAVGLALKAAFDGDPSTTVNIELTATAIMSGIGLIAARDNGVTSEQAGAKLDGK